MRALVETGALGQAGSLREIWRGPRRWMGQQMVGEVARGLSLFGGASSEVRRCSVRTAS